MFKFCLDPKFEVSMAVTVKYILLWIVISCSLIGVIWTFGKTCCLLVSGSCPEDCSGILLQENKVLPHYTETYSRRQYCSDVM